MFEVNDEKMKYSESNDVYLWVFIFVNYNFDVSLSALLDHNSVCYHSLYHTIILPLVLYGCETWYVILGDEHRLEVFQNSVPRKISGPKSYEVIGEWRQVHNEELHKLYCLTIIIRMIKSRSMRWAVNVARVR
jgi:hypothetical protein